MSSKPKKIFIPILISIIIILYFILYFGFIITLVEGVWKYLLAIIPLLLSIVMIKVCIERIREINKGEDDDISKYWLYYR